MKLQKLIKLIVIGYIILIIMSITIRVSAHEIHMSEWKTVVGDSEVVGIGWVEDVGYLFGIDRDGDYNIDEFWRVVKVEDFVHGFSELHIELIEGRED
jgi:hypothetical protein